jgi:hypothetical protein
MVDLANAMLSAPLDLGRIALGSRLDLAIPMCHQFHSISQPYTL